MLLIVLGIVILLVIIFVVMYNGFIRLKNNCDEAFATMDVYLKKRYDLDSESGGDRQGLCGA